MADKKKSSWQTVEEYQAQPKYRSERGPYAEDSMEEPRRERMPSPEMKELSRISEQSAPEALDELYRQKLNQMMQGSEGAAQGAVGKKKGGMVRGGRAEIKGTRPAKLS